VEYLKHALFDSGEFELTSSPTYNDVGLDWKDPANLDKRRQYEPNEGWVWDGDQDASGILWGGCVESIDELLRHNIAIPNLEQFNDIVLIAETSEEMPSAPYIARVFRALGERGILANIQGILIGRAKAWELNHQTSTEEKVAYRQAQQEAILKTVRAYNQNIPVVQNLDFGHTDPQICMPYGGKIAISPKDKKIVAEF
jgi:muramoyltetrapeptide carboxypeptidase LdcA involved in peptidoglycan recycling